MPRIPDEDIQRLKKDISLVRLCDRYNIDLKPQGKNMVGFCPWHKDDTPSFVVTPDKNLWHCMGACDVGGDIFSLVMKAENVSFRQAAEIVMELAGEIPVSPVIKTKSGTKHQILVKPDERLKDTEFFNHVIDFYHRTFMNDPKAMKYLESRHCMTPEAVKMFNIGYANRTLGYRIPGTTADGKALKKRLSDLGILRKTGHEHMSGSVTFPIFNAEGQPVQMYGRKITPKLRAGTPYHLYLDGPINGVFNLAGIVHSPDWILCECIIDALTLWCHGFRNVTCCFGKNTFTKDLWTLLEQSRPSKIVMAFDNDEAGSKATDKLAPKLAEYGVNVHKVHLPKDTDVNDYVGRLYEKNDNRPEKVTHLLEGFLKDAPVLLRGKATDTRIFSLAAKEEIKSALPEIFETPGAVSPSGAEKQAVKEKSPGVTGDLTGETMPDAPAEPSGITAQRRGEDIEIVIGDRTYRVRGLSKNQTFDVMRVNIRVMNRKNYHIDTLDLYNARHRTAFFNLAAQELHEKAEVIKKDLGRVLLKLEDVQDEQIGKSLDINQAKQETLMTEKEKQEALNLLKSPDLIDKIVTGFDRFGLVGEPTNKLTGFLAAISRKLDKPLAVLIQSSSASGKSTLMEAILAMVPEEDKIQYSAMTGQSLFYLGEKDIKHKILAIVEEEGAKNAEYALKLLQSEGKLTIASTGKDGSTGEMVTKEYTVEGPVMILTTTTAIDIDEELLNRCLILTVDESRKQTRAIHTMQRESETLSGLKQKLDKGKQMTLQQNAQRLLKSIDVVNPYANELTFLDDKTRTRRDHKKYQTLIKTITFLYQYQRPVRTLNHNSSSIKYIETTLDDINLANRLTHEVLGKSLDELPPQTRKLLTLIDAMVAEACREKGIDREDYRFTRRTVREYTGLGNTQLKVHLNRLEEFEFLLVHHGGRGKQMVYELVYNGEGKDGSAFLPGLIDVDKLAEKLDQDNGYDVNLSGVNGSLSGENKNMPGSSRPQIGGMSGSGIHENTCQ